MAERPRDPGAETDITRRFMGPNLGYLWELYDRYRRDPDSVDEADRPLLEHLDPAWEEKAEKGADIFADIPRPSLADFEAMLSATRAVRDIRERGHRKIRWDPLAPEASEPNSSRSINPRWEQVSLEALNAGLDVPVSDADNAAAVIDRLQEIYETTMGFEFSHLSEASEQAWLYRMVESPTAIAPLADPERRVLLNRLIAVDELEKFLHANFPGQKRFSLEGLDMLVPMLDEMVRLAAKNGASDVFIGMAHRGRLNVLAHVLGKPYERILAEFQHAPNKELVPSEGSEGISHGWTGDVKYHLGRRQTVEERDITHTQVRVTLANNPSHLEFVNPVVEGMTRAAQDSREEAGPAIQDHTKAMAILIHGDAAFPGEGIVAETFNLSRLEGYATGGTIHIVANNGLGFTTNPDQGRSTAYASDLAKGFEVPVIHVSADDPENAIRAVRLALAYRTTFGKDIVLDLVGFRRWGHNEGDDPAFTQPVLYRRIASHPRVRDRWAKQLIQAGIVSEQTVHEVTARSVSALREAHQATRDRRPDMGSKESAASSPGVPKIETISEDELRHLAEQLMTVPSHFKLYPKLSRIIERWRTGLDHEAGVDWGLAEMLAFASIIAAGIPIRLSGQDSERGTFGQRHDVWHDAETDRTYVPLQHLSQARAAFSIYNSPLSEAGVLGFDYGYSVQASRALVLWEAQFGDFANSAQVLIDQFLAAGRAKWRQETGLVLLLPHGYEGQGPEHSSARLERFLQLSAEENWRVAYPTTAANYFHLLRDQAFQIETSPRPLIVMTPKSLLRQPLAASRLQDLATGHFERVLRRSMRTNDDSVKRLMLCTGKVAVDLQAASDVSREGVILASLEQLYPWPEHDLKTLWETVGRPSEVYWVQEEPANMGAWPYVEPHLRRLWPDAVLTYVGRPARASTAEGLADMHVAEQHRIVRAAFGPLSAQTSAKRVRKGVRHAR